MPSFSFGYIEYDDADSAKKAKDKMDGQEVSGRRLFLDFATPRDSPSGGGGGGGGGGWGRGRGGGGGGGGKMINYILDCVFI